MPKLVVDNESLSKASKDGNEPEVDYGLDIKSLEISE